MVTHQTDDLYIPVDVGREVASLIPGARFIEYPGQDTYGWVESPAIEDIEEFLTGRRPPEEIGRVLATVMFTDIVGSTETASRLGDGRWRELLAEHNALVRTRLARWRGTEVKTIGDGFLATFDGPARAVRCAAEIVGDANDLGLRIRAGLHTGECELVGQDVAGIAVHIGARVMTEAGAWGGARVEHGQGPRRRFRVAVGRARHPLVQGRARPVAALRARALEHRRAVKARPVQPGGRVLELGQRRQRLGAREHVM